ncbi:MAG: porin [Gallionella sp.]
MQKKLIVVALAAAFTLPTAARADNGNFTFYGVADLSYDFVNTGDGTSAAVTATNPTGTSAVSGISKRVVSSNVSKFGFKGSEDLGEGLSANWQIEQQIDIDAAAKNTFASRNTFINVKSEKLGAVLFGIHDTPYKIAVRKLDMFGDNIGDNRALMGAPKGNSSNQGFELRPNNIFMYTSPTFAGFNAAVATVNLKEANTLSTDKRDNITSLAVMYDVAPFYGSIAHEAHKLESNVTATKLGQDESATRVGFAFRPEDKPFEVTAMYEKTTDNLGTAQVNFNGHNAYFLGGKYNIGNNAVKLGYVKAGTLGTGTAQIADSGATQISVGYDHGLSKRTKLYAVYTQITNGKGVNYGFSQSSGAATTNSGFGTSPSVVSLGVKHSF